MIESQLSSPSMTAFLAASFVLAVLPGPGVVYIVTRTLTQGRRAGLASICGIALGNLVNATFAAVGLAILIAASSLVFTAVKFVGALYLVFLGLRALRSKDLGPADAPEHSVLPWRLFRDGFFVALLNPKTAVFFAAFLPQFMRPGAPPLQGVVLGALFVVIAMFTDSLYVLAASAFASVVRRDSGWRRSARYVSAATLLGLGVYAALAGTRTSK
jgi:threonine/homoserine/homoserine lactone efflux protein